MANVGMEEDIGTDLGTEFGHETGNVAAEVEEMGNELEVMLLVNETVDLTVGAEFNSFTELDSAILEYQWKNLMQLYRRDLRTIETASSRNTKNTYKKDIRCLAVFAS